jgi:polyphosphate kinase 2 (PPK2 family)
MEHFPVAGKLLILDGSWYHMLAVERALGICGASEFGDYLRMCGEFERAASLSGVRLIKYWFSASDDEQERRFQTHVAQLIQRKELRLPAAGERVPVTQVRNAILSCTDSQMARWHLIDATNKRQAHLDCMAHLLALVQHSQAVHSVPLLRAAA